ncbi:metal-dependent hydrolase family protein [Enterococcus sp. LJL98]
MKKLLLINGIIEPLTGEKPYPSNLWIDSNGTIEKIQPGNALEETEYEVFDCQEQFILPGLINAHMHLFSAGKPLNLTVSEGPLNLLYRFIGTALGKQLLQRKMHQHAQIELQTGVTTMRSLGEMFYQDVALRQRYQTKEILGPNLYVSGFLLAITGGHGAPYLAIESDSPWDARKSVRLNTRQGVDWIKICVTGGVTDAKRIGEAGALQFTAEEVEAICSEAHKNGTMVAAHVQSKEGIRLALKAGVDTIEHGAPMDSEIIELFQKNPKSLRGFSALVPTFQAAAPFALLDRSLTKIDRTVYENGKIIYEGMLEGFRQAQENQILTGVGNDASVSFVTHYDFWRELHFLVHYLEMTPLQVLQMATQNNAKLMGIDHLVGSIKVGQLADLLLFKDNPVEKIEALQDIQQVIKHGRFVPKKAFKRYPAVDQLLNRLA